MGIISCYAEEYHGEYAAQLAIPTSEERERENAEWFRQANTWNLTPVVELSGGKLDYEEARLARIVLKQRQ